MNASLWVSSRWGGSLLKPTINGQAQQQQINSLCGDGPRSGGQDARHQLVHWENGLAHLELYRDIRDKATSRDDRATYASGRPAHSGELDRLRAREEFSMAGKSRQNRRSSFSGRASASSADRGDGRQVNG